MIYHSTLDYHVTNSNTFSSMKHPPQFMSPLSLGYFGVELVKGGGGGGGKTRFGDRGLPKSPARNLAREPIVHARKKFEKI